MDNPEQKALNLWRTSPYEVELFFAQLMVRKYSQWKRQKNTDKLSAYRYHYKISLQKLKEHQEKLTK